MNKHKTIFVIILILFLGANTAAGAGPITKLGRGTANILTGWIELFTTMLQSSQEEGFPGIFSGIPRGLARAGVRTLAGVYDIATFPFPVPADYEPVLEPEFVQIKPFAEVPNAFPD